MRFARIENGVVREVMTAEKLPPFHKDLKWVAAPAEAREGWTHDGQAFAAPPPAPIEPLRAAAKVRVDGAAETARLAFITGGSGQALAYEAKRREAADCLANYSAAAPPPPGTYLMLDAEVGITLTAAAQATADAYEVAEVAAAASAAWLAAFAAIETLRLTAKRGIAAAPDKAAIDAILAGLTWPQP